LLTFIGESQDANPDEFHQKYNRLLISLQRDLSQTGRQLVLRL
jgi:hypothetical protein